MQKTVLHGFVFDVAVHTQVLERHVMIFLDVGIADVVLPAAVSTQSGHATEACRRTAGVSQEYIFFISPGLRVLKQQL